MDTPAMPNAAFLARLIEARHELTQLLQRLRILRGRLDMARRYLAAPGSNPRLGHACLVWVGADHGATLTRLRTTRREIHQLLGLDRPWDQHRIA